jgi:predicted MFS family arabinose efflux permease
MSDLQENTKVNGTVWILLISAWSAFAVSQVINFGYGILMTGANGIPGIAEDMSISVANLGIMGGTASWVAALTCLPVVILSTKFNPKYCLPVVLILMGIGFLILGNAQSIGMMYVGRILAAVFSGLITSLVTSTKVRGVHPSSLKQINGVENFIGPLGQVLSTLVMVAIFTFLNGWRSIYIVLGIFVIIMACIFFIAWGNGRKVSYGQKETVSSEDDTEGTGTALLAAWKKPVVWLTGLAWPGTTVCWLAMFYYWPAYAQNVLSLSPATCGLVLAMIPIFSAIASLIAPSITNAIGYDKPFIVGWGWFLPFVYAGLCVFKSVPLLMLCASIAGFGAYFFVPLAFTNIFKLGLSPKATTMGIGTVFTLIAIGVALAGTLPGNLINSFMTNPADFEGMRKAILLTCLSPFWWGILTLFLPELGRKKMEKLAAGS